MDRMIAETLNDYLDRVTSIELSRGNIITRYTKLFRGYSNVEFDNAPSIGRNISRRTNDTPILFEGKMIQRAKLKMPELFIDDTYPIQTLTKLQHFGLPTRLLDFTTNSLVALYFACQNKIVNKEPTDGKVLICYEVEDNIQNCYSPFINAIADMNFVSSTAPGDFQEYVDYIETKHYWKFTKYELAALSRINYRLAAPIFFEPEFDSERIKRQQGMFLIFPNKINTASEKTIINKNLVEWEPDHAIEIIIPSRNKDKILRSLVDSGITKSFLFPEPENICRDIFDDIKNRFGRP